VAATSASRQIGIDTPLTPGSQLGYELERSDLHGTNEGIGGSAWT
jgi:hypothetical protein